MNMIMRMCMWNSIFFNVLACMYEVCTYMHMCTFTIMLVNKFASTIEICVH